MLKKYLKSLSVVYAIGAFLHLLDILGYRLNFSEQNFIWKVWLIYLLIADTLAAMFLYKQRNIGEYIFLFIATSQIIAYVGFKEIFGNQNFLITFHLATLILYILFKFYKTKSKNK